mmetsp:Transcript_41328/g.96435  ORF Transcript_41328/g.96435 Transcript_41328/m.96435 type:complete len:1137 (+) Transcript_41328:44-3454(+)
MAAQAEGQEQAVEVAEAPAGTQAPAKGTLAHQILYGSSKDVKLRAQDWAALCSQDLEVALFEVLDLIFRLAGLPRAVTKEDLQVEPAELVIRLPDWVKMNNIDPSFYPLLPSIAQSRRSVSNLEKFIAQGLGEQSGQALLESQLAATLTRWLLVLPNAQIRSVRHVATVAALAVAEALGYQVESLSRSHDTLERQLTSARRNITARQEQQLKRDVATSARHTKDMQVARNQLLETIVPLRSRDISEVIRVYTLNAVERLMKAAPDMYKDNKWTSRVFLMVHDPAAEVRGRALAVITQWYGPNNKMSPDVKERLQNFAKSAMPHLVERTFDVAPVVSAAAVRCLRQPVLAELLEDDQFDTIVNLIIGGLDDEIREEAALFINQHVFSDPGICHKERPKKRGEVRDAVATMAGDVEDAAEDDVDGRDIVREQDNSATAISMLLEFLENYMSDKLRSVERVVAAFWRRAPALWHWGTMVNLCLVGEGSRRVGLEPISVSQRLCLLYIMEAAVRQADEDVKIAREKDKESAALRMNEACVIFLPEMPRLMDICRPEEEHFLLLSHVCKILLEYAVENSQSQVLVNAKAMCSALKRTIESSVPLETMRNCADSLLSLAKNFDEAKTAFLDLSKTVHTTCVELLQDSTRLQELRPVLFRFLTLVNRGIDMSFGSTAMLQRQLALLRARIAWSRERRKMLEQQAQRENIKDEPNVSPRSPRSPLLSPGGEPTGPRKRRRLQSRPDDVPDVRLTLLMLESVSAAVMWHVRMAFWVETQGVSPEGRKAAELQVSEMLQGFTELPLLRAELPGMMTELRNVCMELLDSDFHALVQACAFSTYMTLLHLCVGVSDTLSLEVDESGKPAPATGWGATYKVRVPKNHMEALFNHLNGLYVSMTDAEIEGVPFNAEGLRVEPKKKSYHPVPSQGTLTSLRFLAMKTMQCPGDDPEAAGHLEPTRQDLLLFAVLATRQIMECELEEIIGGPMAVLALTQLEKARPRPLKEAAAALLRRHKESAKLSEEFAEFFFSVQQEAIESLFRCSGTEAAISLSLSLVRQWGVRPLPWMERPLYVVVREAILTCVTPDRSRLPLLDAYTSWIKSEYVRESRCKEIEEELLRQCSTANCEETMPPIARMIRRLRHQPPA